MLVSMTKTLTPAPPVDQLGPGLYSIGYPGRVKPVFAQNMAQSLDQAEAALVYNRRRVVAAAVFRANVGVSSAPTSDKMWECIRFGSRGSDQPPPDLCAEQRVPRR